MNSKPEMQKPVMIASTEKVSVSMQRRNGNTFVEIVSGGRDLTVRTQDGTAEDLRAIAKDMRDDALVRLGRAALVLAGAEELECAALAKKAA
ncbi:hypothetical protein A8H39_00045 [Paraburkholderia fungorum]|uniref:hypothetical protein n=1 Tax=Paraburkholderia fungorum TaxID=134537 RepID=UPI00047F890F|nr:hypothetical protein [Paraburkholderia fungorum]MBB5546544.1 hypothetical protein [Paraburkholderia fungorum]PNE59577.1 hypothetical protein A8H39_00045 [Paraburkholderia fungorum]